MSDPLRIGAAVEGPTDAVVLRAALDSMLTGTEYEFVTLQPEESAAFGHATGGWGGVYRWARQSVDQGGGSVSGSTALSFHDLLIVQVDADVADKTYTSARIDDAPNPSDLPCQRPCPPPNGTTRALRTVILGWLGEARCPAQVVLCIPSKSIETWVIAAVCPNNRMVLRGDWECHPNPERQLGTLPLAERFRKAVADYRDRQDQITSAWPTLCQGLTEAARFETELLATLP